MVDGLTTSNGLPCGEHTRIGFSPSAQVRCAACTGSGVRQERRASAVRRNSERARSRTSTLSNGHGRRLPGSTDATRQQLRRQQHCRQPQRLDAWNGVQRHARAALGRAARWAQARGAPARWAQARAALGRAPAGGHQDQPQDVVWLWRGMRPLACGARGGRGHRNTRDDPNGRRWRLGGIGVRIARRGGKAAAGVCRLSFMRRHVQWLVEGRSPRASITLPPLHMIRRP